MNLIQLIEALSEFEYTYGHLPVYFIDNKLRQKVRWVQYYNDPAKMIFEGIYVRVDNPDELEKKRAANELKMERKIQRIMKKSYRSEQFMKLSDHIKYCQEILIQYGDHEIAKQQTGAPDHYKPINIKFEEGKSGWVKKRTVTDDEEVTVKKRMTVYKLIVEEDID